MHIIFKNQNTNNGDIMNLNIREDIKEKLKEESTEDLKKIINESIKKDELILPGLGVIFETIWENIDENDKDKLIKIFIENTSK